MSGADAWRVAGSYFEACNCEAVCPCRMIGGRGGGRATEHLCQFALSWHIVEGHSASGGERVDLAGLDVVMAGFYDEDEPGSRWQVILYLDDRATDVQHERLADIFLGRVAGTARDNFAAAIEVVHAVRSARIELDHTRRRWSIGVDGRVRVTASRTMASDETVACGIPGADRPGQEVQADVLLVADDPLAWEVRDRCGFATDFDYRSP